MINLLFVEEWNRKLFLTTDTIMISHGRGGGQSSEVSLLTQSWYTNVEECKAEVEALVQIGQEGVGRRNYSIYKFTIIIFVAFSLHNI